MQEVLFTLPYPSSALGAGQEVSIHGRTCVLTLQWDDAAPDSTQLRFSGIQTLRVTYLGSLPPDRSSAYDRVVDVGASPWITEIRSRLRGGTIQRGPLRHLKLLLDDGPLYEFICEGFAVEESGSARSV